MLSTADGNVNLQQVGSECFTQGELVDACATLQLITQHTLNGLNILRVIHPLQFMEAFEGISNLMQMASNFLSVHDLLFEFVVYDQISFKAKVNKAEYITMGGLIWGF